MNCVEFERVLLEDEQTPEQRAHLNSCSSCSNLLADLDLISSQAKLLLAADEPSPAVWNALESRLRREGMIRRAVPAHKSFGDLFWRWRTAWLVPIAAALVIVGLLRLHHPAIAGDNAPIARQNVAKPPTTAAVSGEDQQLLNTVASRPPAQRAKYRADLDDANAFIRDAQDAIRNNPNDVYRQQMLINAYEQKEMLYQLAVDHVSEQ
jgi:hypothetical protein